MIPRRLSIFAAAIILSACDAAPDRPDRAPPPRPASPSASASAPSAPSAAPTATAAADRGPAGTWTGAYEAKKGTVTLPPKVKDKALAADDGKKMAGAGTIEIIIGDDGDVRGKLTGALGACTITGKTEKSMIRASVMPDDPRAPNAMTGVLVGMIKDDVIKADVRVAGPDATVVREAPVELERK